MLHINMLLLLLSRVHNGNAARDDLIETVGRPLIDSGAAAHARFSQWTSDLGTYARQLDFPGLDVFLYTTLQTGIEHLESVADGVVVIRNATHLFVKATYDPDSAAAAIYILNIVEVVLVVISTYLVFRFVLYLVGLCVQVAAYIIFSSIAAVQRWSRAVCLAVRHMLFFVPRAIVTSLLVQPATWIYKLLTRPFRGAEARE